MLKLIIAFATITAVNAVTINTTSYKYTNCTNPYGTFSVFEAPSVGPGMGCLQIASGASGYAKEKMCAPKVGDIYVSTQTQGCNSDCSSCTGPIVNTTFTAENAAKKSRGECYILTHPSAGTISAKVLNPAAFNELCGSSPSPAPSETGLKSSGTRYRHQFGFLTFVVITVLYSL
jgi:hypothetical protein